MESSPINLAPGGSFPPCEPPLFLTILLTVFFNFPVLLFIDLLLFLIAKFILRNKILAKIWLITGLVLTVYFLIVIIFFSIIRSPNVGIVQTMIRDFGSIISGTLINFSEGIFFSVYRYMCI